MKNENFGLILGDKDPKDYLYRKKVRNPKKFKDRRPSRIINEPLDVNYQYNFGTCTGAGTSHAKGITEHERLSLLYSYKNAIENFADDPRKEGTSIRNVAKAAKKYGICKEELYPYSDYKQVHVFPTPSKEAIKDANKRKCEGYVKIETKEELLDAIWKYKSVIMGSIVTDKFRKHCEYDSSGRSFSTLNDGFIVGSHCMAIIGYDEDLEFTYSDGRHYKGFVLIQNSWTDWGYSESKSWIPIEHIFYKLIDFDMKLVDEIFVLIDIFPTRTIKMDVNAFIKDSRTFLPVRFVSEALGADVKWNNETRQVAITLNNKNIIMTINSKTVLVNGKQVEIEVAPFIENERTYLPLRHVSELLDTEISWFGMERKIEISTNDDKIIELWIDKNVIKITELIQQ